MSSFHYPNLIIGIRSNFFTDDIILLKKVSKFVVDEFIIYSIATNYSVMFFFVLFVPVNKNPS